ncbi:MAG: hypothetical protein IPK26_05705 [Planctomycetes bacterium]|nr:hypothetical protein [Planctomycetota bacterium]
MMREASDKPPRNASATSSSISLFHRVNMLRLMPSASANVADRLALLDDLADRLQLELA